MGKSNTGIDSIPAERPKIESVRIETPLGALESDSGNHMLDVLTIGAILIVIFMFKKMYFGKKCQCGK
jgi:hypothetical protein